MSSTGSILLPNPGLCLDAHPSKPIVAIGLTSGGVVTASAKDLSHKRSSPRSISAITHHFESSCRTVSFLQHPSQFLASTAAGDVFLYDVTRSAALQSGNVRAQGEGDGDEAVVATAFTPMSENVVAMGDDNGGLHLLDLRASCSPVVSVLEHGDYISAISQVEAHGTSAVLSCSGDGSLCAYDFRVPPHPRLKLQYAHDTFNDDLLSMAVLTKSNLVAAGTLSGAINLYNLQFMDRESDNEAVAHIDRFWGHPECVNAIVPFEEGGVVLTASTDGIIRVVDVVAKALVGVLEYDCEQLPVGEGVKHSAKKRKKGADAWPVEDMVSIAGLSKPGFALLGHDEVIRFCDGSILVDEEGDSAGEAVEKDKEPSASVENTKLQKEQAQVFAALRNSQRRKKKKKRRDSETDEKRESGSGFFDDL